MKQGKRSIFSRAYFWIVMAFLYMPILVLIVFSFNKSKSRNVWSGFTLDWYKRLFSNDMVISAFVNTIIIAIVSSILATVIGTAAAVGINGMKRFSKGLVMNITYLPVINPEIVTGVSMMLLFVLIRTFVRINTGEYATLIIAHTTFNIPYVIMSVLPKLRQMNKNMYEAALDLGCNGVQAFFKVVMPEIMPGIFTGFLMALTYSVDDFVISYFVAGSTVQTLPLVVYSMARRQVSPEINAISTIMFAIVVVVITTNNIVSDRRQKKLKMREV